MPLRVGIPSEASPPETGRSTAILIVSPDAEAPGVLVAEVAGAVVSVGAAAAGVVGVAATGVAVGSAPHALRSIVKITISDNIVKRNREDFIVETLLHLKSV